MSVGSPPPVPTGMNGGINPGFESQTFDLGQFFGWMGHEWFGGKYRQAEEKRNDQIEKLVEEDEPNPYEGIVNPYNDIFNPYAGRINPYAGQANPYEWGGAGLNALLSMSQSNVRQNFASAKKDVLRSLAQRGQLGQAMHAASLRKVGMDEARALSSADTGLRGQYFGKKAEWDTGNREKMARWDDSNLDNQASWDSALKDKRTAFDMGLLDKRLGYDGERRAERLSYYMDDARNMREKAKENQDALGRLIENGAKIAWTIGASRGGGGNGGVPVFRASGGTDAPEFGVASLQQPISNRSSFDSYAAMDKLLKNRQKNYSSTRGFGGLT